MALFQLLGINIFEPPGVFDQYYSFGDLFTTNIYTMFRGLILDFGFIGSVLFMLATGFLLHWAFHSMLRNKRPVFTVAVFVFMMGYFYTSFIISVLIWSRIYVTFLLLWIVLRVNKLVTQRGGLRFVVTREVTARP
jgi:oligosaccharide repeat unit polymerase